MLAIARLEFVHADIGDASLIKGLLGRVRPCAVVNFAAESHVDRSIHGPDDFISTNVVGTFRLLECVRDYWEHLSASERGMFRFLHVSTDEVYGSLLPEEAPSTKQRRFGQTALMPLQKLRPIIWFVPGTAPINFQSSPATARTIMVHFNFRRN
jgi:dTDP-D-glucose 4,6-dehydratase